MIYKEENGQIVVRLNCQEEISDVINALDLYSRIWIGQLLEIDNQMIWLKENLYETDSAAKMTPFFVNIRNRILPGSLKDIGNTLHSSYGIFSKKIDRRARIAYDMQQVIRYTSAWYFHPNGGPRDLEYYGEHLLREYSHVWIRNLVTTASTYTSMDPFEGNQKTGFTTTVTADGTIKSETPGPLNRFSMYVTLPQGLTVDPNDAAFSVTGTATDMETLGKIDLTNYTSLSIRESEGETILVADVDLSDCSAQ